jgi:hypothetical protein
MFFVTRALELLPCRPAPAVLGEDFRIITDPNDPRLMISKIATEEDGEAEIVYYGTKNGNVISVES